LTNVFHAEFESACKVSEIVIKCGVYDELPLFAVKYTKEAQKGSLSNPPHGLIEKQLFKVRSNEWL
jgi:hypothetical protein